MKENAKPLSSLGPNKLCVINIYWSQTKLLCHLNNLYACNGPGEIFDLTKLHPFDTLCIASWQDTETRHLILFREFVSLYYDYKGTRVGGGGDSVQRRYVTGENIIQNPLVLNWMVV
jgi:hypothetical protein